MTWHPYQRVIPRDLFNEAKLLKCLGQLALLLHEGVGIRWPLRFQCPQFLTDGFRIAKDPASGDICCKNVVLYLDTKRVPIYTGLNSPEPYPLLFDARKNCPGGYVLTSEGKLHPDFVAWLDNPSQRHKPMFSVLYNYEGEIRLLGNFGTEFEALEAVRSAQASQAFDIRHQFVYCLGPDRCLREYTRSDLAVPR